MSLQQAVSHTHSNWRAGEATRAAFLSDFQARSAAVDRCVQWLVAQGIRVEHIKLRLKEAGKPVVTVTASPLLHILFGEECASGGQGRKNGSAYTYVPWKAVRHDCEIHWSEVKQ